MPSPQVKAEGLRHEDDIRHEADLLLEDERQLHDAALGEVGLG